MNGGKTYLTKNLPACLFLFVSTYSLFFLIYFFIEVELIYDTMLVSGVQHNDSVIYIHVYNLSSDSLPLQVIIKY